MRVILILVAALLTGCATRPPESQKLEVAVKRFWPDAEVQKSVIQTAKVCHKGQLYNVAYRVGFFGAIEFQSICLEGFK